MSRRSFLGHSLAACATALTGAVIREPHVAGLSAELRGPVYDVAMFGAAGDALSDDADAINRTVAAAARAGGTVLFHPRQYRMGGPIVVADTTDVSLVGAGATLLLTPATPFGVQLAGVNRSLTITDLRIVGTGLVADDQTGIGTPVHPLSGTATVGLRILRCEVARVVRGIYLNVSGSEVGRTRRLRIEANIVRDIVGTGSGQGYGIAISGCCYSVVAGNLVERTQRHAIYNSVSRFSSISENLVRSHRQSVGNGSLLSAVVAARSSDVTITGNRFEGCAGGAVSVEPHETDRTSASRVIQVLGNRFTDSVDCDVWVGTSQPERAGPLSDIVIANNAFQRAPFREGEGCESIRIYNGVRIRVVKNRFWVSGRPDRAYSLVVLAAVPDPSYTQKIFISDNVATGPRARGAAALVSFGPGLSASGQRIRMERNGWTGDWDAGG